MANFLTGNELEEKITNIIFQAKKTLLILSPYIKLDGHFKNLFSNHIENPTVRIIVIIGKNEDNKGKSLNQEDFEFFKKFPNISILYVKDLHAKYYANEIEGVITSINLYDYSFKNNIEFGISSKTNEEILGGLTTISNPFSDSLDRKAWEKSFQLIDEAEVIFIKRPKIQKKFLGLSTNHLGSEVCYDNIDFFTKRYGKKEPSTVRFNDFPAIIEYGKARYEVKPRREEVANENSQSLNKNGSSRPQNSNSNGNYYHRSENSFQTTFTPDNYKEIISKKIADLTGKKPFLKNNENGNLQINTSNRYEAFIWNGKSNALRISGIFSNREYNYAKNNMNIFQSSKMIIELEAGGNGKYDLIWGTMSNLKTCDINEIEPSEIEEITDAIAKFIAGVEQFKFKIF
jgi:hypothetical protein